MRQRIILQSLLALLLVWGLVAGVRSLAAAKRVTAEKVAAEVEAARLQDWSTLQEVPDPASAKQREEKIRDIASLVNRLDFHERQKNRDDRSTEQLFRLLNSGEKKLFIDLTIRESMGKFMEALDALPPAERKKFVEKGLSEIESGKTGEEMLIADELGEELLESITSEGMRAYFEKASTETKLDLAPLMQSMNEVMQGIRGQELMPAAR